MYDAAVIGAGPAGATAARLLAEKGWSVALVEKAAFPRRKVCGEFLSAAMLPLLGGPVAEAFSSKAGPDIRRVGLYAQGTMLSATMPKCGGGTRWGRALGREHLDTLLRDEAVRAGARLFQPCKLVALERHAGGYCCTLKGPHETHRLSARILIAACGSWEPGLFRTREQVHSESDLFAFKAHFTNSELPSDLMPLLAFPGGYGGMVATDEGRISLSCCIMRGALRAARRTYRGSAADAVTAHIAAQTEGVARALTRAVPDGAYLSAGPIRPGIRARYANGVFFVGNLAGEAHPIIAEGIAMAIQGATLLAQVLSAPAHMPEGAALDEAGRCYALVWKKRFAARIRAAALFAGIAARPPLSACGVQIAERFPSLLTLGAWISGKANGLTV